VRVHTRWRRCGTGSRLNRPQRLLARDGSTPQNPLGWRQPAGSHAVQHAGTANIREGCAGL